MAPPQPATPMQGQPGPAPQGPPQQATAAPTLAGNTADRGRQSRGREMNCPITITLNNNKLSTMQCPCPDCDGKKMTTPDDYTLTRPIPLTERLPRPYDPTSARPQDCDPMGRCWFSSWDQSWAMEPRDRGIQCSRPHWLPWWALPLPEFESHAKVFPTPIAPIEALGIGHYTPEVES